MPKQEAIGYEVSQEWQDFQTGGTRIDAADLNHIEGGVSEACNAIDELRTKRLVTYMVAQEGDTATQDVYQEPILGPCLILDLAERATYYDNGEDGEAHERNLITSGADIDALRDSISRTVQTKSLTIAEVSKDTVRDRFQLAIDSDDLRLALWWGADGIGVWNRTEDKTEWQYIP